MYSWSPIMSPILLKNFFEKVIFHNFAEIEMTRNENWLFAAILKRFIIIIIIIIKGKR